MKTSSFKFSVVLVVLFCILFQTKVVSQNYTLNPGKTFIAFVDTNQINYNGIEIYNVSTIDLDFTWELISKDTLIDCEFDLCNSGICFIDLPVNGVMPTIVPGQKGFLKMHMFSGQTNGVNTIKYVLKNAALSLSDTLTFIINVGDVTGLKDFEEVGIKTFIYPNPTISEAFVNINLKNQSNVTLYVLNATGEVVYKSSPTLNAGSNTIPLDTKDFASGIYTIIISSASGSVSNKLSVTK